MPLRDCLCNYPGEDTCLDTIHATNNATGRTALHLAARHNRPLCIRILIEGGADIEARDNNEDTPMSLASWREDCTSIQILQSLNARKEHLIQEHQDNIQKCFTGKQSIT